MTTNAKNTTTATQDEVIESIRKSQDATVEACRSWAKTLTTVTPTVFEGFPTKLDTYFPKADTFFGFAEKLWGIQRDFSTKLFEASTEISQVVPETAKRASAAAENIRSAAAKV